MLSFTGSLQVFVALDPIDMRKGFEGLYAAVGEKLKADVRSGALFAFTNKKRTRLKILYWDGSGLWVCAKRLEKGRFRWPEASSGETKVVLSHEELALLLGGIDLASTRLRRWHRILGGGQTAAA